MRKGKDGCFIGFDEDREPLPEEEGVKPKDHGGDVLPFDHLSPRQLERLVYLLQIDESKVTGNRVTLMNERKVSRQREGMLLRTRLKES